jgi:hypothetical protein
MKHEQQKEQPYLAARSSEAAPESGPTPGPWTATHTPQSVEHEFTITAGRKLIGHVGLVGNSVTEEANARLIAAAPELLQGLRDAKGLLSHAGCPTDWLDALIAKATGAAS